VGDRLRRYVGFLALCCAAPIFAQTPPDAGSLLKEMRDRERERPVESPPPVVSPVVRPPIRLPDGATIRVARFRITGNQSIPTAELAPLVSSWEGKTLDVAGLNEAASAITRYYQTRGFLLSYGYLPVQKIENDVVEIAVLEGRIGGVQVVAAQDVRLDDDVVQQHIGGTDPGQPARQEDLERRLLLLNDIPGIVARGAFTPGSQPGSSDLVVSVVEDEPLVNSFYVNNHGSNATGEHRLGAQFHLRDIFGVGDSSRLNLSWSSRGAIASGGLSTRIPLGGDGWALSGGFSHLIYELDGAFASLGARGEANALQAGLSYPLIRSFDRNLTVQADYDHKKLRDLVPIIGIETKKTSRAFTTSLNFDGRDGLLGGGLSRASYAYQSGVLNLHAGASDPLRKAGAFAKSTIHLTREQTLHANGQLYARLLWQQAGKNLDSSEKFGLGGPSAVRAYGAGEASVDDGSLITVEYRYIQPLTGGALTWRLFHDHGKGRIDHRPLAGTTDNIVTLKGSGFGVSWNTGGDLDLLLTSAWRGARLPSVNGNREPRVFFQMIKGF
jgi:hemolysin activation/secretion protein